MSFFGPAVPEPWPIPSWFVNGGAGRYRIDGIDVAGVQVSYTRYSKVEPSTRLPLLLVHGGAAQREWWHPTISLLASDRDIVAMDLTGHGHSERRSAYSFTGWVREVQAVARAEFAEPFVLVGHSLGGALGCSAVATGLEPEALVSIEGDPLGPAGGVRHVNEERSPRVFSDRDSAEAHFQYRKERWPEWVRRYIARHVVVAEGGSWRFRHDPAVTTTRVNPTLISDFFHVPTTFVLGGDSRLSERIVRRTAGLARVNHRIVANAGHDLMMERPRDVVQLLKVLCP